MFRNMVTSLFKYERIRTTDTKAKELRKWADHVITLAKRGDLHARRQVLSIMREKNVVHKLFEEAQERFGKLNGGYTRIVKIGRRPGDAAPVSLIELVAYEEKTKKSKKKPKAAAAKPKVEPESPKKAEAVEASEAETTDEVTTEETGTESVAAAEEDKPQDEASEETAEAAEAAPEAAAEEAPAEKEEDSAPTEEEAPKKQEE